MYLLDKYFMKQALKEAIYAFEHNELPIGAIIVLKKTIIARSHNFTKHLNDITAHAEIQVLEAARVYFNGENLKYCSLYVTLEPCIMCSGAILWSKIGRLIFSNPIFSIKESDLLIESFFKKKRKSYIF